MVSLLSLILILMPWIFLCARPAAILFATDNLTSAVESVTAVKCSKSIISLYTVCPMQCTTPNGQLLSVCE